MISIPTLRSLITLYGTPSFGYPTLCATLSTTSSTYTNAAVLINGASPSGPYFDSVVITFNYSDFIQPFLQAGAVVTYEISGGGDEACSSINYSGYVTSELSSVNVNIQPGCYLECTIKLVITGIPSNFFEDNCCTPPPNNCSLNGNTSYTGELVYFTLDGE